MEKKKLFKLFTKRNTTKHLGARLSVLIQLFLPTLGKANDAYDGALLRAWFVRLEEAEAEQRQGRARYQVRTVTVMRTSRTALPVCDGGLRTTSGRSRGDIKVHITVQITRSMISR